MIKEKENLSFHKRHFLSGFLSMDWEKVFSQYNSFAKFSRALCYLCLKGLCHGSPVHFV